MFNSNKVTENDKDYTAIKNIALHQNDEKEHTQDLARAVLASIKQQCKGHLLTSDILREILPKTDKFKDATHKVMCINDIINHELIINQQPVKHIDELIGRATVDIDNESTTLASNIAKLVVESKRRLLTKKPF